MSWFGDDLEPGDSPYRYDLSEAIENGYTEEEIWDAFERFSDSVADWDRDNEPPPQEMYEWFVEILDYYTPEEWDELYG